MYMNPQPQISSEQLIHEQLLEEALLRPLQDLQHIAYKDLSRRDIRSLIFHLLYIVDAHEYTESLPAVVDNFSEGYNIEIPRHSEVFSVTNAILMAKETLDLIYIPLLANWNIDRISTCTKLIMRYGTWELLYTNTDPKIVINEAIELTKCFAEDDAYRFVNGILDKISKTRS